MVRKTIKLKMSDLPIKELKIETALKKGLNENSHSISLKRDGTLIFYVNGNLISSRKIIRNDRFKNIKDILDKNNFQNCYGEMYIDNGNVFTISSKENWNKAKFMPIDLFNPLQNQNYNERQRILNEKVKETNSPFITELIKFQNIEQGWNYVLENKEEGLIVRNNYEWYKIKVLQEAKVKIKEWESGSEKGTFILEDGNRISGTSRGYVEIFLQALKSNKTATAEIEYAFLTKDNKFFQPRLRQIEVN